ncbi:MAG: Txe/YoeB family addiction module toxin [Ezakiella massiliensis]
MSTGNYEIRYTKSAVKDIKKLKESGLDRVTKDLIEVLRVNPFQNPPYFEDLQGNLSGAYSRRINAKHHLVYRVEKEEKIVIIISKWSHYEF